ncbi:MAG: TIGR02281 family clan AA aspartic protease [Pontixanthobacter sp.]
MINRFVLTAGVFCLGAALLGPYLPDGGGKETAQSDTPKLAGAQSSAAQGWNAGAHVLQRGNGGHFYADAMVEGAQIHFIVDTGASVVALTGSDAEAAGLSWDEAEITSIGTGASGTVYGVPTNLSEVELGGIVRRNIPAVIIPEGLQISLLGQSFLSQIGSVEMRDDKMVLTQD